jgi:hypothetical protein
VDDGRARQDEERRLYLAADEAQAPRQFLRESKPRPRTRGARGAGTFVSS